MIHLLLAIIYLSFISLGLPDAVLGSAWPTIVTEFEIPFSYLGILSITIAAGTVFSSLKSDTVTKKFGIFPIVVISVALTAIALIGFSFSHSFLMLCLWAIPYGLGAGSIDAALNNYVALHYKSSHMSWLHCMWGVGATLGPYIMGSILLGGGVWNKAYLMLFGIQIVITVILLCSRPLWKKHTTVKFVQKELHKPIPLKDVVRIPGVPYMMVAFFCFCSIELTTGQWASSYLVEAKGLAPDIAASFGALFYLGITVGRAINGFLAYKFNDTQLIYGGSVLMLIGLGILFLPIDSFGALIGISVVGLGSAPVFPCIIHSTPRLFEAKNSQAVIGVLMAGAYLGNLSLPALFGVIAKVITIKIYPLYIVILLFVMLIMFTAVIKKRASFSDAKAGEDTL